jgi:hypothetical protein
MQVQLNEAHQTVQKKEEKMNTNKKTTGMGHMKAMLSTLWIFLVANYIYCDILSNMEPAVIKELMTGTIGGSIQITQGFLLTAAIMMEIPFAMIVLSRVLKYRANRWANIIAGAIMTVVQLSSFFIGGTPPTLHYIFYSTVEIACNLFIVWYAWKWRDPEGQL